MTHNERTARYVAAGLANCTEQDYESLATILVRIAQDVDSDPRVLALVEQIATFGSYCDVPTADDVVAMWGGKASR
jgi:hypothetical protein